MIRLLSQRRIQANAGILVVDSSRRMVSLNRKFIEMWSFPQQVIVSQDEVQALELASSLVEDSELFIERIKEIYMQTDLEAYDTFTLKDGRMFERCSLPQYLKDECVGRIWKFREITERRQLKPFTDASQKILLFPASHTYYGYLT
ncbi:PAS-domain containing protein [Nostoc sp. UHCC 0302]|uniref:PAS-domain containing protein n=1 Tax=Nostoc sp. UHCC 0302 TaxID=3134896 RepID=UPI00311CC8C2